MMPTVGIESTGVGSGRLTDHIELGVLARAFPRDLLEEVIDATGCRERRSRRLPAHVMLRYVIAQGLWFGQSAEEVMRLLVGSLVHLDCWQDGWRVPSRSAIAQARARLGAAPLRALLARAAVPVATRGTKGAWLRTWRLMSVDCSQFDVADTPANEQAFGRQGNHHAASAFPKAHVATLSEVGTHACVAAQIGGCRTGERELVGGLVGALAPDMLVLADAGLYGWWLWTAAQAAGAQLVWRVSASLGLPVLRLLPDGSYLSVLIASKVKGPPPGGRCWPRPRPGRRCPPIGPGWCGWWTTPSPTGPPTTPASRPVTASRSRTASRSG